MQINQDQDIQAIAENRDDAQNVSRKILIGEEDGSHKITMRSFIIDPGGYTPQHKHNYEHVVRIIRGKGIYVDEQNQEHEITEGYNLFVPSNELHQFKNPFDQPLEILCIILNAERKARYQQQKLECAENC